MIQISLSMDDLKAPALGRRLVAAISALYGFEQSAPTVTNEVKITGETQQVIKRIASDMGIFSAAELNDPVTPQAAPMDGFIPPVPGAIPAADPLDVSNVGFGAGAEALPIVPGGPLATSTVPPVPSVPALPPGVAALAPSAPAAHSNPANGVEVDKAGLPWDGRIHAESKAKNKDGTWRSRRNLADGVYDTVLAELKSLAGVPPAAAPGNVPALPAGASAGAPTPSADAVTLFGQTMRQITPHLRSESNPAGKLTQEDVTQCAAACGLVDASGTGQIMLLQHKPELIPAFIGHINTIITTRP